MKPATIFVVAGGSGGHIVPALEYARQWKEQNPNSTVVFFTGTSELEKKIIRNTTQVLKVIYISTKPFSLRQWWKIPFYLANLIAHLWYALFYTLYYRPVTVATTGGIIAVPFGIAAWLLQKKLNLYELNVEPGKAIKALLPFATTLFCPFTQTEKLCRWKIFDFSYKYHFTPYPLRFTTRDIVNDRDKALAKINTLRPSAAKTFVANKKTMFIIGGSQGSTFLNSIPKLFFDLQTSEQDQWQVIHQTGAFEDFLWTSWYEEHAITAHVFSYNDNIQDYYNAADIIICRAGAGTLFESAFFQKPCIVIPLIAQTTQHQVLNAHAMAEQMPHLFTILEQKTVKHNPRIIADILNTCSPKKKNNADIKSMVSCTPTS